MSHIKRVLAVVAVCLCVLLAPVHGRYLPTRSNEDNLDKLRDLLRDVSDCADSLSVV